MMFKHKLALAVAAFIILLMGNAIFFIYELRTQTPLLNEYSIIADEVVHHDVVLLKLSQEIKFNVVQVQQWLTDISATRGLDGLDDGFDVAEEFAGKFNTDIASAKKIAKEANYTEISELLSQAESVFPAYYQTGQKMARSYVENGPAGGNGMMSEFDAGAEKINTIVGELDSIIDAQSTRRIETIKNNLLQLKANNNTIISIIYYYSGISIILTVVVGLYLLMMTVRSFSSLHVDIMNTADKKYDEALELNPDHSDEFGNLAKNIMNFRKNLKEADRLSSEQDMLKARSEEEKKQAMHDLAKKFEDQVSEMINSVAAAATELTHTAESMGGNISDVNSKAKNASISSQQTAENVNTVASASEEMSSSVKEISSQVTKSTEVVSEAVKKAEDAESSAKSLEEATIKIGDVVGLIRDVAEQTNLLALNATIEAARAGEAGKGFAVVASEVKNLASQTTKATEDISQQIANVQNVSAEVAEALSAIKKSIDNVNQYSGGISAAVEQQSATTNEISHNMQTAARGTQEVNDNISKITESASHANESSMQMLDASRMLSREAEQLSSAVALFLSEVRGGR